jgi:transposase
VCLAHLLRDARYAVECGDVAFSAAFKRLLLRAIAIGRRRDTLKDTTLKQYHADLDRRLDRIMAAVPIREPGPGLTVFSRILFYVSVFWTCGEVLALQCRRDSGMIRR